MATVFPSAVYEPSSRFAHAVAHAQQLLAAMEQRAPHQTRVRLEAGLQVA
jgi:hypothetical protein